MRLRKRCHKTVWLQEEKRKREKTLVAELFAHHYEPCAGKTKLVAFFQQFETTRTANETERKVKTLTRWMFRGCFFSWVVKQKRSKTSKPFHHLASRSSVIDNQIIGSWLLLFSQALHHAPSAYVAPGVREVVRPLPVDEIVLWGRVSVRLISTFA